MQLNKTIGRVEDKLSSTLFTVSRYPFHFSKSIFNCSFLYVFPIKKDYYVELRRNGITTVRSSSSVFIITSRIHLFDTELLLGRIFFKILTIVFGTNFYVSFE